MNTIKFNNEQEFNEWSAKNTDGVVCEWGELDSPTMYPCIMVFDFLDDFRCECADEEEQYDNLKSEGYDSDDIEMLKYHYVYPTDFD